MKVSLEVAGNAAIITLDDEATRNALTGESARKLLDILGGIAENHDIAAVMVTGANETFCSGASRELLARARGNSGDPEVVEALQSVYQCFVALGTLPVPTVACVRGAAVGAGVNLALAADVRIVSTEARFLSGFLRIGVHPGGGHFLTLERLGGPQTTVAMTLFGEEVRGQRLVELGLAWEALSDAEVDARGRELVSRMTDPMLTRVATQTFREQSSSRQLPWQAALKAEQAAQLWSMGRTAS